MDSTTRQLVVSTLSLLLTLIGSCPLTGCAPAIAPSRAEIGTGMSAGPIGPGANVATLNLDGAAGYAVGGAAAIATAIAAYALWKHTPATALTKNPLGVPL